MAEEIPEIPIPVPVPVAQPQLSSSTLVHKLTLKLDDTNFLSWKQHVEGIVRTHRLQSFLSHPEIPPRFLTEEDRVNAVENPAYQVWEQQDSALFTWLLSSLSPSVLPTVVNCSQSWQVWEAVLEFFHAHALAQSTQLRSEIRSISKGSKSCSEYLKRIKSIVNALITIGDPISYREHLEAVFDGLPEEYSHLQTIVYNRESPSSISQVEAMIIAHEARLDRARTRQISTNPPSALLTQAPPPPATQPPPSTPSPVASEANYASGSVDSSYKDRSYDDRSDDRTGSYESRGRGGYTSNNGGNNSRGGYNGRGGGRGNNRSVQCQICKKYGHDATVCYYRGSSSSSTPSSGISGMNSGYGMQFPNFPMMPMPQFGFSPYCGSPQFGFPTQFGQQQQFGHGNSFSGFPFGPQQFGFSPFAGTPWSNFPSQFNNGGQRPGNSIARPPQAMLTGTSQAGGSASANLSTWFPDSGATHHVTNDSSVISDSVSLTGNDHIFMGNGQGLPILSIGSASFPSPYHNTTTLTLKNLLLVPNITKNLVSVSKFARDNHVYFEFHPSFCVVKCQVTSRVLLQGHVGPDGLYVFEGMHTPSLSKTSPIPASASLSPVAVSDSVSALSAALSSSTTPSLSPKSLVSSSAIVSPTSYGLWHSRLGHPHHEALHLALTSCNIQVPNKTKFNVCSACCLSKSHRLPSHSSTTVYSSPLELIFADLWGPSSIESSCGFSYFLTCVDAFSRFTWIFPMRKKSDTCSTFLQFQAMVELKFSKKLKSIQTDNGTEFKPLTSYFTKSGIVHRLTCPYTHHQNGSVERKHRHIVETGLSLLAHAHLPYQFWDQAFLAAVFLINRLPTSVLGNASPYLKLFNTQPDYKLLRVFGCACYPHLRPYTQSKLSLRSKLCVFMGYSSQHQGYKCMDNEGKIYISRDVVFDEFNFPYPHMFTSSEVPHPDQGLSSIISLVPAAVHGPPQAVNAPPLSPPSSGDTHPSGFSVQQQPSHSPSPGSSSGSAQPGHNNSATSSSTGAIAQPIGNVHPMQTRAKSGIVMPRLFPTLLLTQAEPTNSTQALKDPKWKAAMQAEYDALMANGTWTLVPLPKDRKPIGCKWVFRVKENADGTINRYKARLVAKGYHQVKGFDYSETFSPVVKPITIRIILSLAITKKWHIHQLDVNNAFLNGALQEEVYMTQPSGFLCKDKSFVCRLHKALYGLKQAPRAWFERLRAALVKYGFTPSKCDPSLFTFYTKGCVIYILVYVDDIIITGNSLPLVQQVVKNLDSEFSLKQLGQLDYFLGVQVHHLKDRSLLLTQTKYINDLLERAEMGEAKGISTPMIGGAKLSKYGSDYFADPTLYRSIVGALQYATLTRPEISFAVNKVCQFLSQPLEDHWKAVKRILRYLKGTIHHGLHLRPCSLHTSVPLVAFCDADWGSDPDDRRSTSGTCVFFGPNLVSWSSKKQTLVARSSTEAEYRSLANTSAELLWVQSLLQELQVPFSPPRVFCDNMGAVALTHNPVLHTRTKHMELDIFFVREKVLDKTLFVHHIPSEDQIADIFTKALSPTRFEYLRSKLKVLERVPSPPP